MAQRIGAGVSEGSPGAARFAEAAASAAAGLDGAIPDAVVIFGGGANLPWFEDGIAAVREHLPAETIIGCGAQGVLGAGREVEGGGVAVWAASLPDARVESFHIETEQLDDGRIAVGGLPDLDEAEALIALVDPYSFPIEPLLGQLAEAQPGLPVIGGLASAGGPGAGALIVDGELVGSGAVGLALSGVDFHSCVSQGARPIGPEMVVTAAEGSIVYELASRPALDRIHQAIAELDADERQQAAHGLLIGVVVDENKPDYGRGDFLIRGLLGVDEEERSVRIGESMRVGQTVRLQVRDARSAHEDLHAALATKRAELAAPPAGSLMFTCNGRGSHMFGTPDHDSGLLDSAFDGAAAAGFFCAGEIGPVGLRNFVHGFTATIGVFAA